MQTGIDTYVTREEADEYVQSHYPHESNPRNTWENLSQGERDTLLRAACLELEVLPWNGRTVSEEQLLAFPRTDKLRSRGEEYLTFSAVPLPVKYAQIELALWMTDSAAQAERGQRTELQSQGVTGYKLGDLSERYGGRFRIPAPLAVPRCAALIGRYLNGGCSVY